ncbi:MAG TPA: hypothetical protein VMF55_14335 [Solirubrobacterales bacterium]|nr:hypothetical protein [Solirubrobacterales bacterium]
MSDDDRAFDELGLGNDTNDGNDDDCGGRAKSVALHILSTRDRHRVAA